MRPASIILFERLFFAAFAMGLLNSILSFSSSLALMKNSGSQLGAGFLIAVTVLSEAFYVLLWYLIARRASKVAKWILVVLTILGTLGLPFTIGAWWKESQITVILIAITAITQLAYTAVLFRKDARRWFDSGGTIADYDATVFE